MSTIQKIQAEIVEDFGMFDDWMQKYEYLIDLGNDLAPIKEQYKTEDNLIKGCQSRVWLIPEFEEGKLHFKADSDAIITKGIVGMVVRVLNDSTPKEILDEELFFVDKIGLKEHLSPTRSNGLVSMIKKIKMYALIYSAKE